MTNSFQEEILQGLPNELPHTPEFDAKISRAPARPLTLTLEEQKLALKNALRYFPENWHDTLAPEFFSELKTHGRIYMHRFRPHYDMYARPISEYPGKCAEAKAIMHMIQNNLDPNVAQHPYELITYGGNGTVFPNWIQYRLTMQALAKMEDNQCLHLYSGHPHGLFPAPLGGPKLVLTNGMMIPAFSTSEEYDRLAALGVTSYGQMTAGSFMYIGSQGIVHGTFLTVLGAAQKHLGLGPQDDIAGTVFVSSGLGGMSGAQTKAAKIAGAIGVVAEINPAQAEKQLRLGWVDELTSDLEVVAEKIIKHKQDKTPLALGYVGNIVDLWQYLADQSIPVDIGSDQTSLHAPYLGGYYPQGLSFEESQTLMKENPKAFQEKVHESLRSHVTAINKMADSGMFFFDYGNAFLRMAEVAGADILSNGKFKYPSYVENIMGPIYFDYGFGPFRWVCTSAKSDDLQVTDRLAADVIQNQLKSADVQNQNQMKTNLKWIEDAEDNKLVVGSQARILYADLDGRREIALAFNKAIRDGKISEPIVLGRDHHDVSGTDSPYRETANIYDGTNLTADMSVHNFAGLAYQGATWISLHNGGGVGWGYVMNGGFGLVIDGSEKAEKAINALFTWDVGNGLTRRSWAGNPGAQFAIQEAQNKYNNLEVSTPQNASDDLISQIVTG